MADRQTPQPTAQGEPERLVAAYLAGDDGAFTRLVEVYEANLYAYIRGMIGDAHRAEDVFQHTWIKVAAKASLFDGRASFSTWLYSVARNAALDELRRAGRRPAETGDASLAVRADDSAPGPLDRLTTAEAADSVREAVATLPESQREAFLLKEEGGLTFEEIGRTLGCGKDTAKSRFRLAVGKVRAMLGMDDAARGKST